MLCLPVLTSLVNKHARISHSLAGFQIIEANRCIAPEYIPSLNNAPVLLLSYSHEWWKCNGIAGTMLSLTVVAQLDRVLTCEG